MFPGAPVLTSLLRLKLTGLNCAYFVFWKREDKKKFEILRQTENDNEKTSRKRLFKKIKMSPNPKSPNVFLTLFIRRKQIEVMLWALQKFILCFKSFGLHCIPSRTVITNSGKK